MDIILGTLTSIVGTIVGAFLGANIGSEGKQDAITARESVVKELNSTKEKLTVTLVFNAEIAEASRSLLASKEYIVAEDPKLERLNALIKQTEKRFDLGIIYYPTISFNKIKF